METLQEIRNINLVLRVVIFGSWEGIMMVHRAWQVVHQLQLSFQRFLDQQGYGIKQVPFLGGVVWSVQRERASQREEKFRDRHRERKGQCIKPNKQGRGGGEEKKQDRRDGVEMGTFRENSSNRDNGTGEEREQCSNITVSSDKFSDISRDEVNTNCPRTVVLPLRTLLGDNSCSHQTPSVTPGIWAYSSFLVLGAVNFYRTPLL